MQASESNLSAPESINEEITPFYKLQDLALGLLRNNTEKHIGHIMLIMLFVAFIAIHISFFKTITTTSLAIEMVKKIEIISPYIEDLEYKKLKSKFYSIQDFYDYEKLNKELDAIETVNGIS